MEKSIIKAERQYRRLYAMGACMGKTMKFTENKRYEKASDDLLVIPYREAEELKERLKKLAGGPSPVIWEKILHVFEGVLKRQKNAGQQTVFLKEEEGSLCVTFLMLEQGRKSGLESLRDAFCTFGRELSGDCQIVLEGLQLPGLQEQEIAEAIVKAMYYGAYSFAAEKIKELPGKRIYSLRDELKEEKKSCMVTIINSTPLGKSLAKAADYGQCINYARMLGDMPANYLRAKEFSGYLEDLARDYGLECEILGGQELSALHSGGILGVNGGSTEEARLITLYYEGLKGAPVTALVGKGVMFDSGGYHLKSLSSMDGMKYDMCGAANMAAAFEIAVRQKSKKNLLLIIPAVENLIGPSALRMGDVITTMSGKTVEVYNTDAEGRLILCDALTYAKRKGAKTILDLATLTNSCRKALGDEISGIYSNEEAICRAFGETAKIQGEKVWRLPLDECYHRLLYRTQTADLINYAPEGDGAANAAACFLEEFIEEDTAWIHMDIVGTSVNRSESSMHAKGASGILTASVAAFLE
ncbi:M17 family metallopeptidase [Anaerocolumna xylanovorans]|uniref:Probable cytosol aminopeptidase n=1 Tax=Anaerocolumna xylanovorans DSM 12503 TaxID=1121345 RepID=A0A1M7YKU9_9FIRM|nr:leucyl aminopeptidase family protein [Anaerocolumna xylanovorans]SHO53214.1 leucyl aminopeptidase [Anaerocolumna xylanovorans DSM 12503]